eukprot:TRINITY_DN3566_c0_g2_i1.p1 TRINITY_DN3566_c0_g2~~TRINITY_DN3566_c0_g2_i1.p1  ORF type:complete len:388 (+),score=122.56 TRINITY_DN3566_c0_g2_i1:52-1215(+)
MASPGEPDAIRYKRVGDDLFHAQRYEDAVAAYTQALSSGSLSKKVAAIYSNRALCLSKLERYNECIADADACIARRPTWARGYQRKARALDKIGRPAEAAAVRALEAECIAGDAAHLKAKIPVGRPAKRFVMLLRTSKLLQSLADVRKQALMMAIAQSETLDAARDVMMENMADSPYIPSDVKAKLIDLVLAESWDELAKALGCTDGASPDKNTGAWNRPTFSDFRGMWVCLFTKSRKVAAWAAPDRERLGAGIQRTTTVDDLQDFVMAALQSAEGLDLSTKSCIANDMLDRRYDRLLLPDRLDCDDIPRRRNPPAAVADAAAASMDDASEEDEECIICFGTYPTDVIMRCCKKMYCRSCITEWLTKDETCPWCRRPADASDVIPKA